MCVSLSSEWGSWCCCLYIGYINFDTCMLTKWSRWRLVMCSRLDIFQLWVPSHLCKWICMGESNQGWDDQSLGKCTKLYRCVCGLNIIYICSAKWSRIAAWSRWKQTMCLELPPPLPQTHYVLNDCQWYGVETSTLYCSQQHKHQSITCLQPKKYIVDWIQQLIMTHYISTIGTI